MSDLVEEINTRSRTAERQFMSAVIRDPDFAKLQCTWLSPSLFKDERIGKFWRDVLAGVDPIKATIDAGITNSDFARWGSDPLVYMSGDDPRPFAEAIAEEDWMVRVSLGMSEVAMQLHNRDFNAAKITFSRVSSLIPVSNPNLAFKSADMADEFIANLADDTVTIPTNIPNVDRCTGGLWRKNLLVVCARPSVGKSALALQVARNIVSGGKKVIYFSLEMPKRDLWARAVCGSKRISLLDLVAKRLTEERLNDLRLANQNLKNQLGDNFIIDDYTRSTTNYIAHQVAQLKPDVVIVDHLRLMADKFDSDNREVKRLGLITKNLKAIAKDFDVAVMLLAQLNRDLERREDKRPTLADLRDSGEIEEDADNVWGLHRARMLVDSKPEKSPAEMIVLKFRNGPADSLMRLEFDGLAQWFTPAYV